ncbi:MAG: HNH endonuclease [Bacteroidetes bacterium]|nr:HNH endonuclease [Bacteroidota bacterium]
MPYAIITENDTSEWNDETGAFYHYPTRYQKFLQPGAKVIYYKGRMKDKSFLKKRLTPDPHYFGTAEVEDYFEDTNSKKKDFYCKIIKFAPFAKSVPLKLNDVYFEIIPDNRKTNYFRDGVRIITKDTFEKILHSAGAEIDNISNKIEYLTNDLNQGLPLAFESQELYEGAKKFKYSAYYERNPRLRLLAILIHGYDCQVCNFNFKNFYGEIGEGFIHIHHLKPISQFGKDSKINPKEDLAALCANCHSMVHRYKNKVISIQELKEFMTNRPF